MFKTWICAVYGGGAPVYLISAVDEAAAWGLVRAAVKEFYGYTPSLKEKTGGLVEVDGWKAEAERIDNINSWYAPEGVLKRGSYNGLVEPGIKVR